MASVRANEYTRALRLVLACVCARCALVLASSEVHSLEQIAWSCPSNAAELQGTVGCVVHTPPVQHTIQGQDGHPLKVYEKCGKHTHKCIVLLHGRTWSSLPVFDLTYTCQTGETKNLSLMDALVEQGYHVFALDMRGFGGTSRDPSKWVSPRKCVQDVSTLLNWLKEKHSIRKPTVLGWSQGALIAQLAAQENPTVIGNLILYGSIYDHARIHPRTSFLEERGEAPCASTTCKQALEDFTLPGSIADEAADAFAKEALSTDPVKVDWTDLHEFNECTPYKLRVPTLLIHGDQDPYVSIESHKRLFTGIACPDKLWVIIPHADHCAHILQTTRGR